MFTPLDPVAKFLSLATSKCLVFTGDRRAGKTWAAAGILAKVAGSAVSANALVAGPDEQHIKAVMMPALAEILGTSVASKRPDVWGLDNGAQIYFRPSSAEPLRCIPWDVAWHDCRITSGSAWTAELLPRLVRRNGLFVWSTDEFNIPLPAKAELLYLYGRDNTHQ